MADFTQANLDAIRQAIASGVLTVRFQDRTVTYRSMSELLAAEDRIVRSLQTTPRSRQSVAVGHKGV